MICKKILKDKNNKNGYYYTQNYYICVIIYTFIKIVKKLIKMKVKPITQRAQGKASKPPVTHKPMLSKESRDGAGAWKKKY